MQPSRIFHEEKGTPGLPKIIFLHGLLGSSRNWRAVAKSLAGERHAFSLDLRNHGNSFHQEDASVCAKVEDLRLWLEGMGLSSVALCGHSLGERWPCASLAVTPVWSSALSWWILPRGLSARASRSHLQALLGIDLSSITSRKDADEALSAPSQAGPSSSFC